MTDRYQDIASHIIYEAMIVLRTFRHNRRNVINGKTDDSISEMLALSSAIGDGLHNIPHIMVAHMNENDRGDALRQELRIFMSTLNEMGSSTSFPTPLNHLVRRIQDTLALGDA